MSTTKVISNSASDAIKTASSIQSVEAQVINPSQFVETSETPDTTKVSAKDVLLSKTHPNMSHEEFTAVHESYLAGNISTNFKTTQTYKNEVMILDNKKALHTMDSTLRSNFSTIIAIYAKMCKGRSMKACIKYSSKQVAESLELALSVISGFNTINNGLIQMDIAQSLKDVKSSFTQANLLKRWIENELEEDFDKKVEINLDSASTTTTNIIGKLIKIERGDLQTRFEAFKTAKTYLLKSTWSPKTTSLEVTESIVKRVTSDNQ